MLSNVLLLLNKIKVFKGCCCEFETKEDDRVRSAKKWKDKLFPKTENKNILDRQTSLAISNVSTSPKHERRRRYRRNSSSSSSSIEKYNRKYRTRSPRKDNSTENRIRRKESSVVKNIVVTNILSANNDDIIAVKTEHSVTEEQKTTDWTFFFKNENTTPTNERYERKMSIKKTKSKSMGDINESKNRMYYVDMLNNVQRMGSSSDDELSNFQNGIDENGSPRIHIKEIQII